MVHEPEPDDKPLHPGVEEHSRRGIARHYLPDIVYGASDGIITIFAVVAGATGAGLPPVIVIILGFASLLADGFSMGAANYLSMRSRTQSGQTADTVDASRHGMVTFAAFILLGSVPLASYVVPMAFDWRFPVAVGLTLFVLFLVGAGRAVLMGTQWRRSGLEMLAVGAAAAVVAYAVGGLVARVTDGWVAIPH